MARLLFELGVIRDFFGWLLWEVVDWIAPFPSKASSALLPYAGNWWMREECRRCRVWELPDPNAAAMTRNIDSMPER